MTIAEPMGCFMVCPMEIQLLPRCAPFLRRRSLQLMRAKNKMASRPKMKVKSSAVSPKFSLYPNLAESQSSISSCPARLNKWTDSVRTWPNWWHLIRSWRKERVMLSPRSRIFDASSQTWKMSVMTSDIRSARLELPYSCDTTMTLKPLLAKSGC